MSVTLVATPGAADANSYLTVDEAEDYFATRLYADAWDNFAGSKDTALMMATRVLDSMLQPYKEYFPDGKPYPYFRSRPEWTGTPADAIQVLSWPRIGMFDRNANEIAPTVIPTPLKEATAELAFQLILGDRTLDNDVAVKGITSIKAGSVALSFKSSGIEPKVMPDAVWNLLVPSWVTDDVIEYVPSATFEVMHGRSGHCS